MNYSGTEPSRASLTVDAKRRLLEDLLRAKVRKSGAGAFLESPDVKDFVPVISLGNVIHRIESRCAREPGKLILSDGSNSWSGKDLVERSLRVHEFLRKGNFDRNRIAVAFDGSPESLAAAIGVVKSGNHLILLLDFLTSSSQLDSTISLIISRGRLPFDSPTVLTDELFNQAGELHGDPAITPETIESSASVGWINCTSPDLNQKNISSEDLQRIFGRLRISLNIDHGSICFIDQSAISPGGFAATLWSLGCGARVICPTSSPVIPTADKASTAHSALAFSLLFFSSNDNEGGTHKYDLLLEMSKFADEHGFEAVWLPERHFHPVGGLFPNPSVVAAAVAARTEHIRIRAGSVVLPLHHPLRVAEEWAVVDNLSNGRVDLSFARGWNPNDFVFSPDTFSNDNSIMAARMEIVRKLWRGEGIQLPNAKGEMVEVRIFPKPVQKELNHWMTCVGGVERFLEAARAGANILTMLFNQTVEDLGVKIKAYRKERADQSVDSDLGKITLMLHTFVHRDIDYVKDTVRQPFLNYIKSTISLHQHGAKTRGIEKDEEERDRIAQFAYERYFRTGALFGTPETCTPMLEKLASAGINELACQLDFGIGSETVFESLKYLAELKDRFSRRKTFSHGLDGSLEAEIKRHGATHSFCGESLKKNRETAPVIWFNPCLDELIKP